MHYCIIVITDEFPTNEVLEKKLEPYNESDYFELEDEGAFNKECPLFMWDWWQVGGRYGGILKLKVDKEDEDYYRWNFYSKEPRAGRLFRSMFIEECQNRKKDRIHFYEEDYYWYMGMRDGFLYVDSCRIKDVIDFEDTIVNHGFGFIGVNDEAYVRSYWNGEVFIEDDQYEEKVRKAIKDINPEYYVTYVDIHD